METHRRQANLRPQPPRESYRQRLLEILGKLAQNERQNPTPAGESKEIHIAGPHNAISPTFKWIDQTAEGRREGLSGVLIDSDRYLTVDIHHKPHPAYFFHEYRAIYQDILPAELAQAFAEIITRTQNRFEGKNRITGPANGSSEAVFFLQGKKLILGCDDAARGAWSGPLILAGVLLTPQTEIPQVYDSKALSPAQRQDAFLALQRAAIPYAVVTKEAAEIDAKGIDPISREGFEEVVVAIMAKTGQKPDQVLIDGSDSLGIKLPVPVTYITRGESTSKAIAAASIIATATHDQLMLELDQKYPEWKFAENRGYGVKGHDQLLLKQGLSPVHRRSYRPMKNLETPVFDLG